MPTASGSDEEHLNNTKTLKPKQNKILSEEERIQRSAKKLMDPVLRKRRRSQHNEDLKIVADK